MKNRRTFIGGIVAFILLMTIASCDYLFEYSPYQNIVKAKWKQQNVKSIEKLALVDNRAFESFKVGLISDSHTYYDELEKQIDYLNTRKDLDFIIHLGDITLSSNIREFEWYSELVNRINVPVFTLIGNHDCLGNGYSIYTEMFGEANFLFTYKGVKFVFFDDVVWEKSIQDPDFEWFEKAIANDEDNKYVIPFSHIPPWDQQFTYGNELFYNYLLEESGIDLSVHGHGHSYDYAQVYGDVNYLSVPSCIRDELITLDFQADTILIDRIHY
ncbi:metallophosphoesterase family protein [Carboxylicivirga sp. N1Y90]|uniref:metallophosphoesterase family protein n=1 Tax=Carboxylicivirga fragile TaxID=3417571 RepID=UPI003D34873C|nr:metallophosphoesterase [Marinilabiliaceae bacterium N1Y90]